MTKAKCNKCGGSAIAETFELARKLINHAVGLSRGIKCGDSYNMVQEIKSVVKKTSTPEVSKPIITQTPKPEVSKPEVSKPEISKPDVTNTPKPEKTKSSTSSEKPKEKTKQTKSSV